MDPTNPSTAPGNVDVTAEVRGLKSLVYCALLALIVLGTAVDIYLGKQMRLAQRQLYAQQKSTDDSERLVPNFAIAMEGFAATNKDFQPIFDKYRNVFGKYVKALPASK